MDSETHINTENEELISELKVKLSELENRLQLLELKLKSIDLITPWLSLIVSILVFLSLLYVIFESSIRANIPLSQYVQVLLIVLVLIVGFVVYFSYSNVRGLKNKLFDIKISKLKANQAIERGKVILNLANPILR